MMDCNFYWWNYSLFSSMNSFLFPQPPSVQLNSPVLFHQTTESTITFQWTVTSLGNACGASLSQSSSLFYWKLGENPPIEPQFSDLQLTAQTVNGFESGYWLWRVIVSNGVQVKFLSSFLTEIVNFECYLFVLYWIRMHEFSTSRTNRIDP